MSAQHPVVTGIGPLMHKKKNLKISLKISRSKNIQGVPKKIVTIFKKSGNSASDWDINFAFWAFGSWVN